jgi:hypothetical protein
MNNNGGRPIREVRSKTGSYSKTHKGMLEVASPTVPDKRSSPSKNPANKESGKGNKEAT